jgi:hypothetical protein
MEEVDALKLMKALDELEKLVENIQGFDDTISYRKKQQHTAATKNLFTVRTVTTNQTGWSPRIGWDGGWGMEDGI